MNGATFFAHGNKQIMKENVGSGDLGERHNSYKLLRHKKEIKEQFSFRLGKPKLYTFNSKIWRQTKAKSLNLRPSCSMEHSPGQPSLGNEIKNKKQNTGKVVCCNMK